MFSFQKIYGWKEQTFLILAFLTLFFYDNAIGDNSVFSNSGIDFVSWSGRLTRELGPRLLFGGISAATSMRSGIPLRQCG